MTFSSGGAPAPIHPVNPILVWARELGGQGFGTTEGWFDAANGYAWDEAGRPGLDTGFDEQWNAYENHALRVLSRIP